MKKFKHIVLGGIQQKVFNLVLITILLLMGVYTLVVVRQSNSLSRIVRQTNEAQKQWIEEKMLRELENKLRELVGCPKVNVIISVTPVEEGEKKPYMPEEKAKDLMERNPEVRSLVADMGLDTK